MIKPIRYFNYNTGVLLIEWPVSKDLDTLYAIQLLDNLLSDHFSNSIYESVPGYHSLMIYYNHQQLTITDIDLFIANLEEPADYKVESNHWEIPVDYNIDFGIDLPFLSTELELPIDEIINLHTNAIYTIHFIGFLPGFIYLSGLSEKLTIPRRKDPRIRIPKGSVAIAAGQTGIYPLDSPGGWHIIGQTTFPMFDPLANPPSRFNAGDTVRFYNVSIS